jgi:cellulose synthase/poly-beta-1,6-N-acetylglucosamine synthase-like glycosyltransferase
MNVVVLPIRARPPWPAPCADAVRVAVIVPTYRRPQDLARCLEALARQQRPAEQVVVVARAEDEASWSILRGAPEGGLRLTPVMVTSAGVVAALNAGLDAVDADIVAFTDDDAAPRPDWLRQIVAHFAADPGLGGLGGRDWIFQHGRFEDESRQVVGRISWVGRCVGNHHLGAGPPRDVDVLKGANMSFRTRSLDGIRFDERLRGGGAQVGNELGVSLAVKRRGWQLRYDPRVAVDHYPAVRHDEDRRNAFSDEAVRNAAFNETLLLAEHFGRLRAWAFLGWALLVGDHAAPGVLQWLRLLLTRRDTATRRFLATLSGRIAGWRAAR